MLRRTLRLLAAYYGLWQLIHLGLSFLHVFGDQKTSPIVALTAGNMNSEQIRILEASGYIDVLFAAPVGIIFSLAYLLRKRWSIPLGLLSLSVAMYSAYFAAYLHVIFGTFVFQPISFLVGFLSFMPHLILLVLLVYIVMKKEKKDWI